MSERAEFEERHRSALLHDRNFAYKLWLRSEALESALQQISDMGPMSVDDQRWRIAKNTLDALGIKQNAPSV